ncbi:MAG: LPS export ABC transporter periplasmic protein LptC [Ghiorsea sp.]|nr:LPS export ABC transporter periplasmic protein LptC [Ghiorsea sp.]
MGLSIGSVLFAIYFILTAKHSLQEVLDVAAIQSGSRVTNPDIKSYQGDSLSWRLQAKSAVEKGNTLLLEQPLIDLYTTSRQVIPVKGDRGDYNKKKAIVYLQGAVSVQYQGWDLTSERLYFYQKKNVLHIPDTFEMSKEGIFISGKNMRVWQEQGRVSVQDGVHMAIEETQ